MFQINTLHKVPSVLFILNEVVEASFAVHHSAETFNAMHEDESTLKGRWGVSSESLQTRK